MPCSRASIVNFEQVNADWGITIENFRKLSQLKFTCSKLKIETLEKGLKYVQS